jgi:hypothetical protein
MGGIGLATDRSLRRIGSAGAVDLAQPAGLGWKVKRLDQAAAILRHRSGVIPDVIAKVQAVIGRTADPASAGGGQGVHTGRGRPVGGNEFEVQVISYQLSVISYQLSVISYQLSVISYQLSVIKDCISWPVTAD